VAIRFDAKRHEAGVVTLSDDDGAAQAFDNHLEGFVREIASRVAQHRRPFFPKPNGAGLPHQSRELRIVSAIICIIFWYFATNIL
jgi:hypothetical protein